MSHFGTKIPNQLIGSDWANELEDAITGDGTLVSLASYLVYKSGTTYYAKPLTAGGTAITPNADATTVIQATVNALTSGGTIFLKELELPGAVTYGNSIIIIEDYQGRRKIYSNQGKALNIPLLAADPSTVGWGNAEKGYTWFNTTSGYYKYWNGAAVVSYPVVGGAGAPVTSSYVTINDETADLASSVQHANIVDPVYMHGPLDASYVVFKSGATYYARGCGTGFSNYSGADAATVIQAALNALTVGRTWQEKVVLKGKFTLTAIINPPAYCVLDLTQATLELGANLDCMIKHTANRFHSDIIGGILDGKKATYTGSGIKAVAYYSSFRDIDIKSFSADGFILEKPATAPESVVDNFFFNVRTRSCGGRGFVIGDATLGGLGLASDNYMQNIISSLNTGDGIQLLSSANLGINLNSYSNDGNGIYSSGVRNKLIAPVGDGNMLNGILLYGYGVHTFKIVSPHCANNSRGSVGTYDGILLDGDPAYKYGYGDIFTPNCRDDQGTKTQNYAIRSTRVNAASIFQVHGGYLSGNIQTAPPWTGTGLKFSHLTVPRTENSGTGTGNGAEQTIAHGLVAQPNDVSVIPDVTGTTVSEPWADATNIYVTVTNAKAYHWSAKIV